MEPGLFNQSLGHIYIETFESNFDVGLLLDSTTLRLDSVFPMHPHRVFETDCSYYLVEACSKGTISIKILFKNGNSVMTAARVLPSRRKKIPEAIIC